MYRGDKEEGKELSHGENAANLSLMRQLDELHMTYPAWGYRKLTAYLRNNGVPGLNGKRVRRLLRKMGIAALYPKPNLSRRLHAEYVRPYLLKGLTIDHVDQVWGVDYSGPHVKDQKGAKKSLGQDSRNEALFIHATRGYPSR